jgi:hypothetical protein
MYNDLRLANSTPAQATSFVKTAFGVTEDSVVPCRDPKSLIEAMGSEHSCEHSEFCKQELTGPDRLTCFKLFADRPGFPGGPAISHAGPHARPVISHAGGSAP